jgi:hypothetical protein
MAPPARFGREEISEDIIFLRVQPDGNARLACKPWARLFAVRGFCCRHREQLLPGENDVPRG